MLIFWCYFIFQVITPNMYNMHLWETSGHAANYKENMFVFEVMSHHHHQHSHHLCNPTYLGFVFKLSYCFWLIVVCGVNSCLHAFNLNWKLCNLRSTPFSTNLSHLWYLTTLLVHFSISLNLFYF